MWIHLFIIYGFGAVCRLSLFQCIRNSMRGESRDQIVIAKGGRIDFITPLKVFALDLHSNRLIYRSGITPETPGGESWLALDLPILPTFDEELKAGTSRDEEGPLLPVCFPQDEVIQLIARVLQLTNPSFDHRMDENLEFLSVPEGMDLLYSLALNR